MDELTRIEIPESASKNVIIEGNVKGTLTLVFNNCESVIIQGHIENLHVNAKEIGYLDASNSNTHIGNKVTSNGPLWQNLIQRIRKLFTKGPVS